MTTYRSDFDPLFIAAANKYLPTQVRWQWMKAEAWAESKLDPDVTAPDGGMGIAQFMPPTWREVCDALDEDYLLPNGTCSAYNPTYAIPGMCWYWRSLWDKWTAPRPYFDRLQLTQSAYNAGFGNLIRAQRLANGANDFESIIAKLHLVTGEANAKITQSYIARIHDAYEQMTSQLGSNA